MDELRDFWSLFSGEGLVKGLILAFVPTIFFSMTLSGGRIPTTTNFFLVYGYLGILLICLSSIEEKRKRRYDDALRERHSEDREELYAWMRSSNKASKKSSGKKVSRHLYYDWAARDYMETDIGRQYTLRIADPILGPPPSRLAQTILGFLLIDVISQYANGQQYAREIAFLITLRAYESVFDEDNCPLNDAYLLYRDTNRRALERVEHDLDAYLTHRAAKPKPPILSPVSFFDHNNKRQAILAMTVLSSICVVVLAFVGSAEVHLHSYVGIRALVAVCVAYTTVILWRWRFTLPGIAAGLCMSIYGATFVYGGLNRDEWMTADLAGAVLFGACALFGIAMYGKSQRVASSNRF